MERNGTRLGAATPRTAWCDPKAAAHRAWLPEVRRAVACQRRETVEDLGLVWGVDAREAARVRDLGPLDVELGLIDFDRF